MPGRAVDLEDPNPFCSDISVENKSHRNYFSSVKRKDVSRIVKSQMKDGIMSLQSYHIRTGRQYTWGKSSFFTWISSSLLELFLNGDNHVYLVNLNLQLLRYI